MPDGAHIGFNHRPLRSVSYDPTTGNVRYQWVDSLAGWWVVKSDGSDLRRHLAAYLDEPAGSALAGKVVFTAPSKLGYRLFTLPLVAGLPDAGGFTRLQTPNRAGSARWSPAGDSLVYFGIDPPAGTWLVGADGGGARLVYELLDYPDWHPSLRKVLGVPRNDSSAMGVSTIVEYNLDSRQSRVVLRSTSVVYRWPRYAPDGARIAFLQNPASGGSLEVWVVNPDGASPRRLVKGSVGALYSWSPAGTEIAYVQLDDLDFTLGNGTVWVVNVSSGVARQLTMNP